MNLLIDRSYRVPQSRTALRSTRQPGHGRVLGSFLAQDGQLVSN